MVRMFIRHVVRDYRVWRRAYNAFDKERRGMGVVGHAVYRAVAKPNEVTVSHDFASISKAKAFAARGVSSPGSNSPNSHLPARLHIVVH